MTRSAPDRREGGFALVSVMVFMAMLMLFGGVFITHVMTTEESEVEGLLAESRAYWAMLGHYNYLASRAAKDGLCSAGTKGASQNTNVADVCSNEAFSAGDKGSIIGSLRDYLDGDNGHGIQNGDIDNPGTLTWVYPQNPVANGQIRNGSSTDAYRFAIRGTVAERLTSSGVAQNDGQVRIDLEVASVGTAPVLTSLGDRVQRLTIGFCVVDLLTNSGDLEQANLNASQCPSSFPVASRIEGQSFIQFVVRNHPLP